MVAGACSWTLRFAAEGDHQVTGRIDDPNNGWGEVAQTVTVDDVLVVSLGDSVASGEGVPTVPGQCGPLRCNPKEVWEDAACHRSPLAGPALAARQLETADPKSSVTFVHLACSGATVDVGLIQSYQPTVEPGTQVRVPSQIQQAADWTTGRTIDVALVSVGASDVGLSDLAQRCVIRPDCSAAGGPVRRDFEAAIAVQADRYLRLRGEIDSRLEVEPGHVVVTHYFDPTTSDNGERCVRMLDDYTLGGFLHMNRVEADWMSGTVVAGLNREITTAAGRWGWTEVDGIAAGFSGHGYCATPTARWIRTRSESRTFQGDTAGSLHPNEAGHRFYASRIVEAVQPLVAQPSPRGGREGRWWPDSPRHCGSRTTISSGQFTNTPSSDTSGSWWRTAVAAIQRSPVWTFWCSGWPARSQA